jgi:DNA-binding IclR family transcriptional regulator
MWCAMLLAYQDATIVEGVIRQGLTKFARNTITDATRFRAELRKVRAQGYAYDDLEFADDMRCVAVPVFENDSAPVGGISLCGPSSRFTAQKLRDLGDRAVEAAGQLSLKLRGRA